VHEEPFTRAAEWSLFADRLLAVLLLPTVSRLLTAHIERLHESIEVPQVNLRGHLVGGVH
jgi:hypothetical protein